MIKLIKILRPFAPFMLAAWIITIISVSSIPGLPVLKLHIQKSEIRLDYLMHFCEYGFLAFVAYLSFAGKEFGISIRTFILVSVCLIIFSIADELHQKFIPGRTYNIKDLLSDVVGIMASLSACYFIFRNINRKFVSRKPEHFRQV